MHIQGLVFARPFQAGPVLLHYTDTLYRIARKMIMKKMLLFCFFISLLRPCQTIQNYSEQNYSEQNYSVQNNHAFSKRSELIIIVPGTWTFKEKWYKIGGDFFEKLQNTANRLGKNVIWFRWVSCNHESHRKGGAEELAHLINNIDANIHIISHSHGANIALGASQILAEINSKQKIKTLYTLGTPVHEETYTPNMNVIEKLYNLYSLNDGWQTFWGYKRVFQEHPNIFNIHAFVNGKEPTHSEMHAPTIGTWIMYLPELLHHNRSVIHFLTDESPTIENDAHFTEKLSFENDRPLNLQALFYSRKKRNL